MTVVDHVERAEEFLGQKRPQGAVTELKMALQKQPKTPELRLMLAKSYLALGQLENAEKELLRHREFGGEEATTLLHLSDVWSRQHLYQRIIDEIQEDPQWPPKILIPLLERKAAAFLGVGERAQAQSFYRRVLAQDPDNKEALIGLARIAKRADDEIALQGAINSALRVAPNDPYLLRLNAGLAFGRKDYTTAAEIHRRRLADTPKSIPAKLQLAETLLAQGQIVEAKSLLQDIVTVRPRHHEAHYLLAVIAIQAQDYAAAQHHGMKSLAEAPRHRPSQFIAGVASYALGNFRKARWYLGLVLEDQPNNAWVTEILEDANARYAEEIEHRRAKPAKTPLVEDIATFGLAEFPIADDLLSLLETGDPVAITAAKEKTYVVQGRLGALLVSLAHQRAGEVRASRATLEHHLDENPEDIQTREILANLYTLDGNREHAEPHLRWFFESDPHNPIIMNNLSFVLMTQGELSQARSLAERAVRLSPEDPRILDTLGVVMLRQGDAEGAIPLLSRAARNEAAGPEISLHLAQALRDHGKIAAARSVLQDLLASESSSATHGAAETLLRDMSLDGAN
jgi:predicted Zn-dependent protease